MGGVKPAAILTDQCSSIEKVIENVLSPHTVHRFCSWHILHKLSAKWDNVDDKSEKN
jgi:MULE transposase domain